MKSLVNYMNNESQESPRQDFVTERFDDETLKKLEEVKNKIEKLIKSMNIGNFKYEITSERVTFELGRRYDFWIELNRLDNARGMNDLYFSSIASYGNFTTGDETYEFYKAVGLVLSQEDKLEQLKELFQETRMIENTFYNSLK